MAIHYASTLGTKRREASKARDYKTVKEAEFKSPWKLLDCAFIIQAIQPKFFFLM